MKRILSLVALLVVGSFGMASAEDLFGVEHKKINFGADIASTFEYHFDLGFNSTTSTGTPFLDESGGIGFGIGYNVSNNLYAGFSTGYIHDFGINPVLNKNGQIFGNCDFIPCLADLQVRWNPVPRFSLFLEGRAGAFINTHPQKDATNPVTGESGKYTFPNYSYYDVQPGVIIRPRRTLDVRISFGLGYAKPGKEPEGFESLIKDEKAFTFKVGIARRFGKNAF